MCASGSTRSVPHPMATVIAARWMANYLCGCPLCRSDPARHATIRCVSGKNHDGDTLVSRSMAKTLPK